jgi:predicted alpha/beta hydrolase
MAEVVTLTMSSGRSLAVEIREPDAPSQGTVILLHSMMVSRRIWNSPREQGFVRTLNEAGLRTLALDFRGHGESGPRAARGVGWTYDELVREDIPAICRAARERWKNERLTMIGHSLGGHAALASVATLATEADALVAVATNIWLPSEEGNPVERAQKGAIVRTCQIITKSMGYFPARALGLGSDDEAAPVMENWAGWWRRDCWTSGDGKIDYLDALARVHIPVLGVASVGDRRLCTPACAARYLKHVPAAKVRLELVRSADDGGDAPDHMQLVTTRAAASMWRRIAAFCSRP